MLDYCLTLHPFFCEDTLEHFTRQKTHFDPYSWLAFAYSSISNAIPSFSIPLFEITPSAILVGLQQLKMANTAAYLYSSLWA